MGYKWIKENQKKYSVSDFRVQDSWILIQSGELNIHKDWFEHRSGPKNMFGHVWTSWLLIT